MVAAGSRVGSELSVEGTALCDCVDGARASNQDAPDQPPQLPLDTELQGDSEDDSDDDRTEYAHLDHTLDELCGRCIERVAFGDRRTDAAQRIRDGHGARGPPLA